MTGSKYISVLKKTGTQTCNVVAISKKKCERQYHTLPLSLVKSAVGSVFNKVNCDSSIGAKAFLVKNTELRSVFPTGPRNETLTETKPGHLY